MCKLLNLKKYSGIQQIEISSLFLGVSEKVQFDIVLQCTPGFNCIWLRTARGNVTQSFESQKPYEKRLYWFRKCVFLKLWYNLILVPRAGLMCSHVFFPLWPPQVL